MQILAVNAGSSSLKFQMYEMPAEKVIISGVFERIGIGSSFYTIKLNGNKVKKEKEFGNHDEAVAVLIQELFDNNVVKSLDEIVGIGHRVVHGASKYADSVVITDEVLSDIEDFISLAPLHNPANIMGIKAFKKLVPDAIQVAVFDTAFHQTMSEESYLYPVPYSWYEQYGVRKYGFHGTSHKYLTIRMSQILNKKEFKLITCHLGNGGSISAVKDGQCIDTSMGFTPNAGIMMGTRSGDIDATIIPYVMEKTNKSLDDIINDLNKNSGYLGISSISSDSRDIENGIADGNEKCILAQKMYIKKIVEYIAKYYVLLGGADAICFSAGIGENSFKTRKDIIDSLACLGIKLDEEANQVRGEEKLITTLDSVIPCYIVPTDEELMIARDTLKFVK
ncbi:MAG: acetate kinase [Bacilli bacterium]|nr:acetate kinase [Bacilli bacterium]MDD4809293.1 acetate kinase [Bacilli bacterium]